MSPGKISMVRHVDGDISGHMYICIYIGYTHRPSPCYKSKTNPTDLDSYGSQMKHM
jgi:hypothetical protein